jgi:hypothetical protein
VREKAAGSQLSSPGFLEGLPSLRIDLKKKNFFFFWV